MDQPTSRCTSTDRDRAQALLDFIDESPSPWHAVESCRLALEQAGFSQLSESSPWTLNPGGRHFVIRGGSSLIAFVVGTDPVERAGFLMIGAHTDSPGLRIKPRSPHISEDLLRLGVEIYGGPILASFADRDLSLAGRVNLTLKGKVESRLIRFEHSLIRLPNLAIHMNRGVNEEGLKFQKQTELPLLLGELGKELGPAEGFRALLADRLATPPENILNWDLAVFDTQKGSTWGLEGEYLADSQLDNLASCHAGLLAISAVALPAATCICGFFDHEEVGSESAIGAGGSFMSDLCERITSERSESGSAYKMALSNSFLVSADMAHAFHPNFPSAYEPNHHVRVNGGPVIKTNANRRYATDSESEAFFMQLCGSVGVPYQQYVHRTDLGCGSTIGPMLSARLGVKTVDVGCPMWAMHSVRESAGVKDHSHMITVLKAFFTG